MGYTTVSMAHIFQCGRPTYINGGTQPRRCGEENGQYAQNRMLFYKDTGDVSQEVWDILLYQWLTSSNVADRRILMEAHNRGDVERKMALHESYYPKTSSLLEEHLNTFMEQLDRLGGKADGKDPMEHPRLPLILSHNEFVRRTFLMVRNRYFGY
mmetsp:Transcript_8084/g.11519  ORF Transcript_8084/g.11519 Transcript_8084/m.11519 type:complete len:155 (+) Transcript_8084:688-1152(+)